MSNTMTPAMIDCLKSTCTATYAPTAVADAFGSPDIGLLALSYLAIGAVVWMLMYRAPVNPKASALAIAAASVGAVILWPAIVAVILGGCLRRWQR